MAALSFFAKSINDFGVDEIAREIVVPRFGYVFKPDQNRLRYLSLFIGPMPES
jgi:hypothetical protein